MKKCKIITINDGSAREVTNDNFLFVEEYDVAESIIDKYLEEGYEIKHMVPVYDPAIQGKGNYTFYRSGCTFYMEKDD